MREAIRRILWFLPTLVVVTVLAFGAVSGAFDANTQEAKEPLFFNTSPQDIGDLAWQSAQAIANQQPDAAQHAARLVKLGAAILPYLMHRLDGLSPEGRRRVALALLPLAKRLGVAAPEPDESGAEALRFWNGFWGDHAVDFKPLIVKRVVRRFATRSTRLRRRELLQLDTFALGELIRQMSLVSDPRSRKRLLLATEHITGLHPEVLPATTRVERDERVRFWQSWWARNRHNYVKLQGFERLLAPILQTRYATWAREAARSRFGALSDGQPALVVFRETAPLTFALLLSGLIGGTLVGIVLGTISQLVNVAWLRRVSAALALSGLSVPVVVLAAVLTSPDIAMRTLLAFLLMLLMGSALAGRHQAASVRHIKRQRWLLTYRACGLTDARLAWITLRPSCGPAIASMATHTTTLLSSVFILEYAFDLAGAGQRTIQALHEHDLTWLMLVTLATAILVSLIQLISATALNLLEPWRRGVSEHHG